MKKFKDGDKISGVAVTLFAVVGNTDEDEGRGRQIDKSYHLTKKDANIGAAGAGPAGSDGGVEPRLALKISEDGYILLPEKSFGISLLPEQIKKLRRSALAKLSPAEKQALSLED